MGEDPLYLGAGRLSSEGIPSGRAERGWLARHRITPRKRLGQNFLIQPQVASRLARVMDLEEGESVLEVGAGSGALTRALLDRGVRVWANELDPRLLTLLAERFSGPIGEKRLELIPGNLLEINPEALLSRRGATLFLAGNLPYQITTPILLWTIENRRIFRGAAVLVQKEVADRMTAGPGTRAYGSLSVWVSYHAAVRRLTTVGPGSFWPVPEVDSSLISLTFHKTPPVALREPELLERVLRMAFGQRRKMLRTSLGAALGSRELAIRLLEHAEIAPTRRAETLSLEEFAVLADTLGDAL
jgi:16S rRNA (adenine1518-N6/adenine1519-N6)-dimethyltransferase